LGGSAGDDGAALAARVLGARHVLQSLAQRSGRFPRAGAIVDALHATSMFALAAADTERRRPALIDGSIAAALSASGFASYRIRRGR
jgi:hypothetical protein